jgi:hypothetical protein
MMKLVKKAKSKGCQVERTGTSHWKITTPSGLVIVTSFSPSNPGPYRDTLKALKKAGVQL